MNYVRCINNQENKASLDVGTIYRGLQTTAVEKESGMSRIIDNEGEDYLYLNNWFEAHPLEELVFKILEPFTIHLNDVSKIAIRDLANAKGLSMSALVREWINERLDLPAIELAMAT